MAYKLLDQNGNYMEINGMHKGTIVSPYVYNGMELYNENAIATNRYPFYANYRNYRTVRIGNTNYYPSGTTKKYVDEAYSATEVAINGRYSKSSYKNYEVYKDGNLVASGSFTNSAKDIYVCEKNANTSIIISGIWDDTNSKFIYNITTNATIERSNNYYFNNGIVTTSTLTKNGTIAGYGSSKTAGITVPSEEEIFAMLPSDSVIISATYSTVFSAKEYSTGSTKFTYYFRTDYDDSYYVITTLPGSSLGTISSLGYNQSGSFTRTGTSYLGKTYYLYYHASTWERNQYRSVSFPINNESISCTTTATVKYRYFDEVRTAIVNVTRTNANTLPSYSIDQVKKLLPSYGTSTVSSFKYHYTVKNNASSGSYTYFKIMEGSSVKQGPYSLSLGSTRKGYVTYSENMSSTLNLIISTASDGTYVNGSDIYISLTEDEGSQYLEIEYTWEPL